MRVFLWSYLPLEGEQQKRFPMTGCSPIRGSGLGIGFVEVRGELIPFSSP